MHRAYYIANTVRDRASEDMPDQPLKPLHYLILLLLAEEPTYGIRLMERLEERSAGALTPNAGTLYRTLAALVDDGWVEPVGLERPEGAGAPRKSYGVTETGLAVLGAEARRQAELVRAARALDLLEDVP